MGGKSGAARDRHMADLIAKYMPKASSRKGGPLIARGDSASVARLRKRSCRKEKPEPVRGLAEEEEVTTADEATGSGGRARGAGEGPAEAGSGKQIIETETVLVEQAYAEPAPRPSADLDAVATASVENSAASEPSGWVIQIASSPSKDEANAALDAAKNKASAVLASASSYTVPFNKGGVTYHRARFSGFDSKTVAMKTCNQLKKKRIACFAVQN